MSKITKIQEARKAIMCLRLEVDRTIVDDILKKVEAAFEALASQQGVEADVAMPCGCENPELYLHDGKCENCMGVLFPPRSLT